MLVTKSAMHVATELVQSELAADGSAIEGLPKQEPSPKDAGTAATSPHATDAETSEKDAAAQAGSSKTKSVVHAATEPVPSLLPADLQSPSEVYFQSDFRGYLGYLESKYIYTPFGQKWMSAFPDTCTIHFHLPTSMLLNAVPTFRKLAAALEKEKAAYVVVGGAVRDAIADGLLSTDIDVQVWAEKPKIKEILEKHYDNAEINDRGFAFQVGAASFIEPIDVAVFDPALHTKNFVENDVNDLLYHCPSGMVIDPHGTGYSNCQSKQFQIPADSIHAWHVEEFPGRKHNGKAVRMLKFLAKGYKFKMQSQRSEYITLMSKEETKRDLTDPTGSGSFSTLAMVLGQVRGDTLDQTTQQITIGTDPVKLEKYHQCIQMAEKLDLQWIPHHMALTTESKRCSELEWIRDLAHETVPEEATEPQAKRPKTR